MNDEEIRYLTSKTMSLETPNSCLFLLCLLLRDKLCQARARSRWELEASPGYGPVPGKGQQFLLGLFVGARKPHRGHIPVLVQACKAPGVPEVLTVWYPDQQRLGAC